MNIEQSNTLSPDPQKDKLLKALIEIKFICLATIPGREAQAFSRIVRLCIDAGITHHMEELIQILKTYPNKSGV